MSDWCCKKHSDIFGPPYFVRFHPDACPYCKIDHLTAQLEERDEAVRVLSEDLQRLEKDERYYREEVERWKKMTPTDAIAFRTTSVKEARKQAARECLNIIRDDECVQRISSIVGTIKSKFGLEV